MSTVLVVDDLRADRRIVGGLLAQDDSLQVIFAENGQAALDQIELHVPDLVLTDLQMPEMNGLELVEELREKYPLIPTILMTAAGSENIAVEALEKGASSYVPKKHLASELLETTRRVLAMAHEDRQQTRLMFRQVESCFELENDPALLSAMVGMIRTTLRQRGICNENDSLRAGTAVDEALMNSYYHGNLEISSELKEKDHELFHETARKRRKELPYRDRRIRVQLQFNPDNVLISIADDGQGFSPESLPDPTDPAMLDRPCGRGLLLMRAFMDDVRFNEQGNQVTLVKHRSADGDSDDDD